MFDTLLTIVENFEVSKAMQAELGKLAKKRHGDDEKISITKELPDWLKILNTNQVSLGLKCFHHTKWRSVHLLKKSANLGFKWKKKFLGISLIKIRGEDVF